MLQVVTSNCVEVLAEALADRLRQEPAPLLAREIIVAPSTALARWLEFRLADALGIAARIDWAFPAELAWRLMASVLPEIGKTNPFDPRLLQWRLLRICQEVRAPALMAYLKDDDGRKGYELAVRIASALHRYLVERPEWPIGWARGEHFGLGEHEAWQAEIWRRLVAELPVDGMQHPAERFFLALEKKTDAAASLPRRIAFFCVDDLPELYWRFFQRLADHCAITNYVLSPSREYWGELVEPRRKLSVTLANAGVEVLFEIGHPLLASLGRGRRYLAERLSEAPCLDERYQEPAHTLLGRLQADLLALQTSSGVADDGTVEIHACHGPQREAEVLRDRLLAWFMRCPTLTPADLLILTPDIDAYGPVVGAVLEDGVEGQAIPCRLADLSALDMPLLRALRCLLETLAGDFQAEAVMELLEEAPIRRAFAIQADEIPLLRVWVAEAGVRWGLDGAHRERRDLPVEEMHTWRFGMMRCLLAIALSDDSPPYRGVSPLAGVEGQRAELLGRFLDYLEALRAAALAWQDPAPPHLLCDRLLETCERFLAPDEEEADQMLRLRRVLREIRDAACAARVETPVQVAMVLAELGARLAERRSAHAFVSGCATIAQLAPGRPLAKRIVCLVGMNDGAWPRAHPPEEFDLLAQAGSGRDRRAAERYAFLETLLSARDALIVTFTGADSRGHAEFPPAAPVAELVATLAHMTGRSAEEIIVRHPLQPFAQRYFSAEDARLFSYAQECCPPPVGDAIVPFVTASLPAERSQALDWRELVEALCAPARFFLRRRLGLTLEPGAEQLAGEEPFVLSSGLAAHQARAEMQRALEKGVPFEALGERLRAQGYLPHGFAGELTMTRLSADVEPLWRKVSARLDPAKTEAMPFTLMLDELRLEGVLERTSAKGLARWRAAQRRARDLLRVWLEHVLWQVIAPAGAERTSVLFTLDGEISLAPLPQAEARDILAHAARLAQEAYTRPLPFHPETAWAYVSGKKNWRHVFWGSGWDTDQGEIERDPYLALAWRDREEEALGEEFQALARRLLEPLCKVLMQ
ncbi:MAG: exodeoxyribonuclease V subunit gamma [Rhodocyclaceae bacterium]|nr:exodeoxyribonuclease V subunit gamma [Rhodocyclaceae bacterium]